MGITKEGASMSDENKVSIQEGQEGGGAKIILWDEAESWMTGINLSTGNGNSQSNTLSILGGKILLQPETMAELDLAS